MDSAIAFIIVLFSIAAVRFAFTIARHRWARARDTRCAKKRAVAAKRSQRALSDLVPGTVGKLTSVENGPERDMKLVITAKELRSEISSPAGVFTPESVDHYELSGLQEGDTGLVTITFVLVSGQRVRFYSTESKFDMALLLDELDGTIGERRRVISETNEGKELFNLVSNTAFLAERYAYSTSVSERQALAEQWSIFREDADAKSQTFASLRPLLGRMSIQLDNLVMHERQCLPPGTYGRVLLSDKNVCHKPCRELRALADKILTMIVERNIA